MPDSKDDKADAAVGTLSPVDTRDLSNNHREDLDSKENTLVEVQRQPQPFIRKRVSALPEINTGITRVIKNKLFGTMAFKKLDFAHRFHTLGLNH